MARRREKKCPPAAVGVPLWMVTYSDMVTLLLTFFVMMMAMANFADSGRVEAVLESLRNAFGAGGFDDALLGLSDRNANQANELDRDDSLQPEMSRLMEALARHLSDDSVRMSKTRTEIRVSLNDKVLFAPGSTELHPAAYALLTDIGEALAGHDLRVSVQGHTDNSGDQYHNWELSALRAASVLTVLQDRGHLDGRLLDLRGFGQFQPVAVEGTGDPAWDRRVELVIQSDHPTAYDTLEHIDERTGGFDGR